ncbi:MAG: pyruvate kinase [Candidatus Taylorbacteria bacterium]|nr:pyruvate kinase [Candidatus Taylorbacteria bacterium]
MKINFRKSKILGKIADNKSDEAFLKSVFDAGLDIAWLNTAHQGEADAEALIARIKSVSPHVALMIDTKGPEVRTKNLENPFPVKSGDVIHISGNLDHHNDGAQMLHVDYPNFHNEVPVGTVILYDDATIGFTVTAKEGDSLKCVAQNTGTVKNKKSVNVPGVHIELPALTEKDKSFIRWCGKHNIEFIIHSFVRGKQDLLDIKAITDQFPGYKPQVISKIENREGFDNTEEILNYSDGLMVARGDLGAEVPFEEMPFMQKKMVEAAMKKGKASVVATQVLDSMIKNPRPTRAEVLDVANAVLEGSGAVSMSGETAYGEYPVEATSLMSRVMVYTESKIDDLTHYAFGPEVNTPVYAKAKEITSHAKKEGSKAILATVTDPALYYALSAYRPSCIVIAACNEEIEARKLMLYYAVRPIHLEAASMKTLVKNIDAGSFAPTDRVTVVEDDANGVTFKTVQYKELA